MTGNAPFLSIHVWKFGHHLPLYITSANIISRQSIGSPDKPSIPLRRILSDNSSRRTVSHTQRLSGVKLITNEVSGGSQRLTQSAEEPLAGLVDEGQAGVCVDHQRLLRIVDLVDDY